MNFILLVAILGLVLLVILSLFKNTKNENYSQLFNEQLRPYIPKNPLTATEVIFYHKLIEALPEHIVLAQVQLSSFLKVDTKQIESGDYRTWFNPISQQSIDFLICTKDFSIITAIELDDKTHNSPSAIERDTKKNENLKAAQVPLIRWHAEKMPDLETIKQAILKYTISENAKFTPDPDWLADDQESYFRRAEKSTDQLPQKIIFGIILVALSFWGVSYFTSTFTKAFTSKVQNIQSQSHELQIHSNNQLQQVLEKQKQDKLAQDAAKLQEHQAELNRIQQQNAIKELRSHENELKEEAWDRDYKKNTECGPSESMVTCGNRYIQLRDKFEKNWDSKQIKLN